MLRLEAFIDDNKAAKVLHALDGLVIQLTMVPVKNAVKKGTNVVGAGKPTTAPEVVLEAIRIATDNKHTSFTLKELITLAETYGVNKSSLSYGVNKAVDAKLLKKKGGGVYQITNTGAK